MGVRGYWGKVGVGTCGAMHGRAWTQIQILCSGSPLPSLRWPSLLAKNNQVRCESHPVARRVGGSSRAAADEPKSSGADDRVYPFLYALDQKDAPTSLLPRRGRGRGSYESTHLRFIAFRDSYTKRWEIQFIFTAYSTAWWCRLSTSWAGRTGKGALSHCAGLWLARHQMHPKYQTSL